MLLSNSIDVAVASNNSFVRWARARPARKLPSGKLGVVVNRVVLPVYKSRFDCLSIELSDSGVSPDDCSFWPDSEAFIFVDDTTRELEVIHSLEWYLETNIYGHYLVFDGDESTLTEVLQKLSAGGIEVRRHGTSHRPADNGFQYDWFIRLTFDGDREQILPVIEDIIEGERYKNEKPFNLSSEQLAMLNTLISMPEFIWKEAIAEGLLQESESELSIWLAQKINALSSKIDEINEKYQTENDELLEELNEVKEINRLERIKASKSVRIAQHQIEKKSEELDALKNWNKENLSKVDDYKSLNAENAKLKEELRNQDELFNEWENAEIEKAELKSRLEDSVKSERKLIAEIENLSKSRTKIISGSAKQRDLIKLLMMQFRNLDIHPDVVETLNDYFSKFNPLISLLERLNDGEKIPAKILNGIKGNWFEINQHIQTGSGNTGRIYYTKQETGRLCVVVHMKKDDNEQKRFIKRLEEPSFLTNLAFD